MSNTTKDSATEARQVTWPETKKTSAEIEDRLIRARVKLLISQPFFGNLATRLKFVDATDWCPTAATDGRHFYYNRHFTDALKDEEIEFLVGHEVLHNVYDHMDKDALGDRDRRLANMAQDYVINGDLVDASIGKKIDLVEICFDWQYRGKHWFEVYDELFQQAEAEGRVRYIQSLDEHLDAEDLEKGEGDGDDANDGTSGPVKYSQEELEQIRNEVQSSTMQAARAAGAGNTPAGVKRLLKDFLNPQLDWRTLIAQQIQSIIKSDYTMSRPSRKGQESGFILPGMDRETTIDVAIGLDLSGSIDDEMLQDFMSEVKGVMDQYTDFKIHLFCFDTQVHNPQEFTENNMSEFLDYELAGGGGTDFDCCWEYMKDNNIQPNKFIMFTDGYPWNSWGDENYCDTLFIVHGGRGSNHPVAPFGITVPYSRD